MQSKGEYTNAIFFLLIFFIYVTYQWQFKPFPSSPPVLSTHILSPHPFIPPPFRKGQTSYGREQSLVRHPSTGNSFPKVRSCIRSRSDSVVKRPRCYSRGFQFNSQHLYGDSQSSVSPEDSISSSVLNKHQTCMCCISNHNKWINE